MPKVLPEYLETRRKEILDAAAGCFARRGFHQTSMQDICEESNLSPGAVYRYFRSKDEIIEAMCARGQNEDAELIRSTMTSGGTLDAIDELARLFILNLQNSEQCILSIELASEARRNPVVLESIQRTRAGIKEPLIEFVRLAQARGDFDPDLDPTAVATMMTSMYLGLLVQLQAEPEIDTAAYTEVVRAMFGGWFWRGPSKAEREAGSLALRH
jgi:AcrR family transcriptional regulator